MPEDCLVCQEHRFEVPPPGGHLISTDEVVAFHLPPWPPPTRDVYLGYLMVTSRRHVAGFAELTDDEAAAIGRDMARLSRALKRLGAERVYSLTTGHGCPHLHVHLVPRWPRTPESVSWLEVDDWDGARRGNFDTAAEFAVQLQQAMGS